jgi:hypothetical protein
MGDGVGFDFRQLIDLWATPLPAGDAAVARFARHYSDPVKVNGVELPLAALVERARATQAALADLEARLLVQVDAEAHSTIVFRMRGRHVGPLATPLGPVAPTGKVIERQVMDLLALRDGLIHEIWVLSDELGALVELGVLRLA